jgi:heme exporter protein C
LNTAGKIEAAALTRSRSRAPSVSLALLAVAFGLMLANMYLIFMWAPTEAVMGHVQRIFYIHVPMAWLAFGAFGLVFIGSAMYLWRREQKWDILASCAAEIGVVFTSLVLITGPIWAKPVWGIWWEWDARLTTTLMLWLIYVGYLMLRAYSANRAQAALYSAVVGVVGFIDVPIVYFAVNWWQTQHQRLVIGSGTAEGSLHSDMRVTLYFSLLAFSALFAYMLWQRISTRRMEEEVRWVRHQIERETRK